MATRKSVDELRLNKVHQRSAFHILRRTIRRGMGTQTAQVRVGHCAVWGTPRVGLLGENWRSSGFFPGLSGFFPRAEKGNAACKGAPVRPLRGTRWLQRKDMQAQMRLRLGIVRWLLSLCSLPLSPMGCQVEF